MSYRADKVVIDTHTRGPTDPQTQAMTIPEGQKLASDKCESRFVMIRNKHDDVDIKNR